MNKKIKLVLSLFVFFIFILEIGCQKQSPDWKGTIKKENGVTFVKNPKEAMYTADVFTLEDELSITEDAGGGNCIFSQIRSIEVDKSGRMYILDQREAHVYVFDSEGNYVKTFGEKGQGPGELNTPFSSTITSRKELAVENFRRGINFYSLEGDFIRELSTAKEAALRIGIDSRDNIFGIVIVRDEEDPRYEVRKFDPQMNKLNSLLSSPLPNTRNEGFNPFGGAVMYAIRHDDYVICASPETYTLNVFDSLGDLVMKISKDYDPVKITKEEKEEVTEGMPAEIQVSIPKHHNPFRRFIIDDECRIWVMTYEQVEEEEGFYHDVFDSEGKFIAKIPLKVRPFVFKNKKLYTVEEDEEGFLFIKRYKVLWKY